MPTEKFSDVVHTMIKTNRMHKRMLDGVIEDIGISRVQHFLLMNLYHRGKCPSQKDMARHLNITPAAVTLTIKRLEGEGYVERKLGSDSRNNELLITEKGRRVVEETKKIFDTIDKALFDGFSESEILKYTELLIRMQENMKKYSEERNSDEKMV